MKENVERNITNDATSRQKTQIKELFTGPVLKPLGISLGIMLFQQTTGINAIVFYTVSIFQTAGSTLDGRYATIIVGFVQLVFTVASGFLVNQSKSLTRRTQPEIDSNSGGPIRTEGPAPRFQPYRLHLAGGHGCLFPLSEIVGRRRGDRSTRMASSPLPRRLFHRLLRRNVQRAFHYHG